MFAVRRLLSFAPVLALLTATASLASAAITLNANTSPAAAKVGDNVTVTGTGFPAGSMPNTSVSVTVTCPPGNGGAVTVQSTSVLTLATQRIVTFQIPPSLTVNQAVA